ALTPGTPGWGHCRMGGGGAGGRGVFEGRVLIGRVSEEPQVDARRDRVAAEERGRAECGRVRRDQPKAEHVPIEFGKRDRVQGAEADVADTNQTGHFLLCHRVSMSFWLTLSRRSHTPTPRGFAVSRAQRLRCSR